MNRCPPSPNACDPASLDLNVAPPSPTASWLARTHLTLTARPKSMSLMSQSVAQREERSTFSGLRGAERRRWRRGSLAVLGGPSAVRSHFMSLWATPASARRWRRQEAPGARRVATLLANGAAPARARTVRRLDCLEDLAQDPRCLTLREPEALVRDGLHAGTKGGRGSDTERALGSRPGLRAPRRARPLDTIQRRGGPASGNTNLRCGTAGQRRQAGAQPTALTSS